MILTFLLKIFQICWIRISLRFVLDWINIFVLEWIHYFILEEAIQLCHIFHLTKQAN